MFEESEEAVKEKVWQNTEEIKEEVWQDSEEAIKEEVWHDTEAIKEDRWQDTEAAIKEEEVWQEAIKDEHSDDVTVQPDEFSPPRSTEKHGEFPEQQLENELDLDNKHINLKTCKMRR